MGFCDGRVFGKLGGGWGLGGMFVGDEGRWIGRDTHTMGFILRFADSRSRRTTSTALSKIPSPPPRRASTMMQYPTQLMSVHPNPIITLPPPHSPSLRNLYPIRNTNANKITGPNTTITPGYIITFLPQRHADPRDSLLKADSASITGNPGRGARLAC